MPQDKTKTAMFMRRLLELVKDIKQAIQKQTKTAHEQEERRNEQQKAKQQIKAEISFDKQAIIDSKAEQNRNYRVQNSIRYAAWYAFIAATIYAGITALQLREVRKANTETINEFRASERPYIWTDDYPEKFPFAMGRDPVTGIFSWNVVLRNYGKSVAATFCSEERLRTGADAMKDVPYIEHNTCQPLSGLVGGGVGGLIPPGKGRFVTAFSVTPVTDDEVKGWYALPAGVVVYGRFDYDDSFGTWYFSQYCITRQQNGVLGDCPGYDRSN